MKTSRLQQVLLHAFDKAGILAKARTANGIGIGVLSAGSSSGFNYNQCWCHRRFAHSSDSLRKVKVQEGSGSQEGSGRRSENDVAQKWAESLIKGGDVRISAKRKEKQSVLKRPPPHLLEQRGAASVTNTPYSSIDSAALPNPRKKYRRRMTDNTWTSEPLDERLVWVDCEMTGLNPEKDHLLEIGILITDGELNEIARHEEIIFHMEESVLQGMDAWCLKHHGESGLIDSSRKSSVTHAAADDILLEFVKKHTKPGECPIAGNSVGMDRVFISRQLPKLHSHLHYRNVDVSTLKELVRRWYPDIYNTAPAKKYSHRAHDDIMESINELKFYRSAVFIPPKEANCKAELKAVEKK